MNQNSKDKQMTNAKEDYPVRLQIPLHEDVVEELKEIAECFDRPMAWMAREMLEFGLMNQESFIQWMTFRMIGKVLGNKREKMQSKHLPDYSDGHTVRIQVNISESVNERLTEQAKKGFRPVSNMASLLIVRTLDDEAWLAKFMGKITAPIRAMLEKKKPKKKSRKVA